MHIHKDLFCIIQYPNKNCLKQQKIRNGIHTNSRMSNCGTDWERARGGQRQTGVSWIKEATWNKRVEPTMNRDEGGYRLSNVWDSLLTTPSGEQ